MPYGLSNLAFFPLIALTVAYALARCFGRKVVRRITGALTLVCLAAFLVGLRQEGILYFLPRSHDPGLVGTWRVRGLDEFHFRQAIRLESNGEAMLYAGRSSSDDLTPEAHGNWGTTGTSLHVRFMLTDVYGIYEIPYKFNADGSLTLGSGLFSKTSNATLVRIPAIPPWSPKTPRPSP